MAKEPKRPVPDDLIALQREANAARRQAIQQEYSAENWRPWLEASTAVDAAVTEHAAGSEWNRYELEMETKRLARLADEAEAG